MKHFLGDLHQILVISIGHVKFTSGEFRVVCHVYTLISELSPNLVHSVKPTNYKHLQVQLRCHSHEQIHVQVVVVSDKRLCSCATWKNKQLFRINAVEQNWKNLTVKAINIVMSHAVTNTGQCTTTYPDLLVFSVRAHLFNKKLAYYRMSLSTANLCTQ